MIFNFKIDIGNIAERLNRSREAIEDVFIPAFKSLSIATHGFVIRKATDELEGYKREAFLGKDNKNVRWTQVGNGIYVVEIDEKASWIEDGRPATSMATEDWLLKPGKVKHAKDGSTYRAIPFTHTKSGGNTKLSTKPGYQAMVENAMKQQGISQRKIEKDDQGNPKLGVIHKLKINPPGPASQFPGLYSRPRSAQDAALSGLKPHGGIFLLKGAVVTQRKTAKGKVVKETVVFRTVSSKHQAEGRWMYPEVKPFGALKAAYDWANAEWEKTVKLINDNLSR